MKRVITFILLALMLIAVPATAEDTLRVGVCLTVTPFGSGYEAGDEAAAQDMVGLDIDYVAALVEKLGCEAKYVVTDAGDVAAMLESGEIDIAIGGLTEEAAPEGMLVTDSYASNSQMVIVREDSEVATVDDALSGRYTIAVREDTAAQSMLEAGYSGRVTVYDNGADAAADVVDGDIDVLIIDANPGSKYEARNVSLMSLDEKWVDEDYCIYVADEALFEEVTAAMDALKSERVTRDIVNSYIFSEEASWWNRMKADFRLNFIEDNRWHFLTDGLVNTLKITFVALLIGIFLGVLVALVRTTYDKNYVAIRSRSLRALLKVANSVCNVYLTVIRGTPAVVQLMIMYYIVFASSRNGVMIAMISFGINSGAYVAEIIRGGIMSIDNGQTEAGRSLGFSYPMTMIFIVIPQAFKNVLPALANEFIVLLKETSVAGYVAVEELTKGGDIIRGTTYSPFMPLIAVALIYLVMVVFFTKLVAILERRLRNSDH